MPEYQINQILSQIIKMGDTPIHDAIISLIFTSGLKPSIFRDFTIKDFVKSCDDYFNEGETNDIITLLDKDPNQIFCCWEVNDDSTHQVTFSTPETTEYIFIYLKQVFDIEELGDDDFLFRIKNDDGFGQIRESYVSDMVRNKKNSYNDRFNENIILTPNSIIRKFKFICNEHLNLGDSDKSALIDLFSGKALEDNKYYLMFKEDKNSIFRFYKQIAPYLVINNIPGISGSDESLKHESNDLEINEGLTQLTEVSLIQETQNQHTTQKTDRYKFEIKNYFENTFNVQYIEGFSLQNKIKLLDYAFRVARKDIENSKYEESNEYYDNLLKKGTFYVLYRKSIDNSLDNLNFDEISPTEPQERIDMVCDFIKNMNISDFNLSDDELGEIVGYQFAFHENVMGEFNEEIFEKILLSSLFEIMKNTRIIQ